MPHKARITRTINQPVRRYQHLARYFTFNPQLAEYASVEKTGSACLSPCAVRVVAVLLTIGTCFLISGDKKFLF